MVPSGFYIPINWHLCTSASHWIATIIKRKTLPGKKFFLNWDYKTQCKVIYQMYVRTFRIYWLEILSSAATYKRMKTELLYWPRRIAKAWTKLNLLSDHSPSGPMLDSSTGQRKGECLSILNKGFTSAFSILSEMSKCDNNYSPDNSNPAAATWDKDLLVLIDFQARQNIRAETQSLCSAYEHRNTEAQLSLTASRIREANQRVSQKARAGIKSVWKKNSLLIK